MRDVAQITADLSHADDSRLAESQARLQSDFERHEAKFSAELAALVKQPEQNAESHRSEARWLLARKCWSWLYRD